MKITVQEKVPKIYVMTVEGHLDYGASPKARKAISSRLQGEVEKILVDLSCVDYIDSSGIASLVEGQQECQKRNIRFALAGMTLNIEAVFDLAKVNSEGEQLRFPPSDGRLHCIEAPCLPFSEGMNPRPATKGAYPLGTPD